jgi:hypothetical protein
LIGTAAAGAAAGNKGVYAAAAELTGVVGGCVDCVLWAGCTPIAVMLVAVEAHPTLVTLQWGLPW